jgi:hypothetical protein
MTLVDDSRFAVVPKRRLRHGVYLEADNRDECHERNLPVPRGQQPGDDAVESSSPGAMASGHG